MNMQTRAASCGEYILAFDTANEVVAVGVGRIDGASIELVAHRETAAHRASNTILLSEIDAALADAGVEKASIAAVVCGRGPGSFTGVRICMATAKGAASALEVPLYGVSTLDAVAWRAWGRGVRGRMLVVADAMRKEIYPALFEAADGGVERLTADAVVKAADAPEWVAARESDAPAHSGCLTIIGDALAKYREVFEPVGSISDESLWPVSGDGLLLAAQAGVAGGKIDLSCAAWHGESNAAAAHASGDADPVEVRPGDPSVLLPVYTRLSDAEENERIRLAKEEPRISATARDLKSGVQHADVVSSAIENRSAVLAEMSGSGDADSITYKPLDAAHAASVAAMERECMGSDAWGPSLVADELPRRDRTWWAAYDGDALVGYCGGWVVAGQVQILKIATDPVYRRRGIAAELISLVASDARNLGATEMTLEVRESNTGAQAFYEKLGLANVGVRPRYYSDRKNAVIMTGPLPRASACDKTDVAVVAGMHLQVSAVSGTLDCAQSAMPCEEAPRPLILAIESSCDETAASIIDGDGGLHSDVVASQIDFHSRFGGVVPEIASRKHIEAICGVCDECLAMAAASLGVPRVRWRDLDAIAVTYAPGLVGALVVGLAFAKGAAWGADKPLIAVNHLEGHLYANRIAEPDICPPMVVSLVSGGHTMLVHVRDWGDYETLGSTIDDAVGEAFDKVAKALGLGYPGGPIISKLAAKGNPKAIAFPRALLHSGDLRFSLSGLKTAVTTYIHKEQQAGRALNMPDIAASFEAAVVDVQVAKAKSALLETGAKEFCLGGGVAANPMLRDAYKKMCGKLGVRLTMPPLSACGDQAAMIAEVARDRYAQGKFADLSLDVKAHAPLDEAY